MPRRRKSYDKKEGVYYFNVWTRSSPVLIYRKTRKAAKKAYMRYSRMGKRCEWLGKWSGSDFVVQAVPSVQS